MEHGFAHCGHGAGVVHVGAEICAVIDAAEHPLRVGNQPQQSETGAIGRRAVDREALLAARLDPDALVPGHRVADARLRPGRRHDDRVAERASCVDQRLQASGVNAVVVGDEKIHLGWLTVDGCGLFDKCAGSWAG